ncbi:hypothetical protein KGF56_000898 [Candida oxycetoniae]|uniref:MICOS complex subunit n=1 Tax=Candida oxycetoniae TaxID=497107 RepID=A0AAI9T0L2_9ASCO|nr:uncharacterized protein KGF56_000898 [Candida oxycetoniae]KAI3406417.1 hypothetical protein KGF56_000898 [Candida oxycetoniae]
MIKPVLLVSNVCCCTVGAALVSFNSKRPISNESKRKFYEDDTQVVPVPGTVVAAPASEIESLGQNRMIDGISVRSTEATEEFFKTIRSRFTSALNGFNNWLNHKYTKFNETERYVTNTVSSLHYRKEDILPNGIYVIIAILSGTIAARPRGLISRITFPTVAGLVAFKYFLPVTFDNTREFVWLVEQRSVPQVAQQQENAYHSAIGLAKSIEEGANHGVERIERGAHSLKQSIAEITGLNIDEEVSKKK